MVFTESCETELEIVEMCFVSSVIDPVICQEACAHGTFEKVKDGGEDLKAFSHFIGQLASIVLQNKVQHCDTTIFCMHGFDEMMS